MLLKSLITSRESRGPTSQIKNAGIFSHGDQVLECDPKCRISIKNATPPAITDIQHHPSPTSMPVFDKSSFWEWEGGGAGAFGTCNTAVNGVHLKQYNVQPIKAVGHRTLPLYLM